MFRVSSGGSNMRFIARGAVKLLSTLAALGVLGLFAPKALAAGKLSDPDATDCVIELATMNLRSYLQGLRIWTGPDGFVKGTTPLVNKSFRHHFTGELNTALRSIINYSRAAVKVESNRVTVFAPYSEEGMEFELSTMQAIDDLAFYARYLESLKSMDAKLESWGLYVKKGTLTLQGYKTKHPIAELLQTYQTAFGIHFTFDPGYVEIRHLRDAGAVAMGRKIEGKNVVWLNAMNMNSISAWQFKRNLRHEAEHILTYQNQDFARMMVFQFPDNYRERLAEWGLYADSFGADEFEARIAEVSHFLEDQANFRKLNVLDNAIYFAEAFAAEQVSLIEAALADVENLPAPDLMDPSPWNAEGLLDVFESGEWLALKSKRGGRSFQILVPAAARFSGEPVKTFWRRILNARLTQITAQKRTLENLCRDESCSWSRSVKDLVKRKFGQLNLFDQPL